MGIVGRITGRTEDRLKEDLRIAAANNDLLAESFSDLEQLAREDAGWRRLSAQLDREFTRDGLGDLIRISRAMYMSNPPIQRAVNVSTFYTWAQGVEYTSTDEDVRDVIDDTTHDPLNRREIYGHQAQILTDVDQMNDGNIFLALFTEANGHINIRSVPTDEIIEIFCHEDDWQQVTYYRRKWVATYVDKLTGGRSHETKEALYPDISWQPDSQPSKIGNIPVEWDAPIIHQRTGGLKQMQFGVPETFAAVDWARANRQFLEDWHTIVASLARFAWRLSSKGSKAKRLKEKFGSSLKRGESSEEQNYPPAAGSVLTGADADLTPISKNGATTSVEDSKASRLMIGMATGVPDNILSGDPQQGALATAKTLDRPTELGFVNRQSLWADFHKQKFRYAIDYRIRNGIDGWQGEVVRTMNDNTRVIPETEPNIVVKFPPILVREPKDMVSALVSAATLDGKTSTMLPRELLAKQLMQAVGIKGPDIEKALTELPDEERQAAEEELDALADAVERFAAVVGANGNGAGL